MGRIVGRSEEQALFRKMKRSSRSEFIAVYGRRRIGKTYLIRNAFDNKFHFHITGLANTGLKKQLYNFHTSLKEHFRGAKNTAQPENWFEAFQQLIRFLGKPAVHKKIIFFDELPWLDTPRSDFISALEHFWNSWASPRKDIILIVCGSAASWMINKLINDKGGLHNRLTYRMKLEPFTLAECEQFFQAKNAVYDRYQIIQLYMVLGGVPYYLEYIDVGRSAVQNINTLCFSPNSMLRNEFNNLYASLFKKSENHIAIVEALARKNKGLSREELIKASGLPNGGGTSRLLIELEESSFIRKYTAFGKHEKNSLYQLIDSYSLFYLKFIKKASKQDKNIWLNSFDSPPMRAWSGYAFEQVCLQHIDQIKQALGISGVQTETSSWTNPGKQEQIQIDLVIDRADRVINLCEMKFSINPFSISKKYETELWKKIEVFKQQTRTRKTIFLTLITTYGLHEKKTFSNLVQNNLTMNVLFRETSSL